MQNYDDYRLPKSIKFDRDALVHLKRIRLFEIKDDQLIAKRKYEIDDDTYEVNSIFSLDSKKSAEDNIIQLMKKDFENSLDIQGD